MYSYFVISDIHSFATEMKKALYSAGFRKTNDNHILICCGDLFDRGDETLEVYRYIKSIPKKRRILIRGNHELLYLNLLCENFPSSADFSNGTVKTFCHVANVDINKLSAAYWLGSLSDTDEIAEKILETWQDIRKKVAKSEITAWLKSIEWKNYFELNKFIFVHSFIPFRLSKTKQNLIYQNYPLYAVPESAVEYNKDWRSNSTELEWEDATWGCPWKLFKAGLFSQEAITGKVLVCGHWHVSDFHENLEGIKNDYSIYFSDHLIGLDACTAFTKRVNVLVIDGNKVYDQYKKELTTNKIDSEPFAVDKESL